MLAGALVVIVGAIGGWALLFRSAGDSGRAQAQRDFHRWTLKAVPVIVSYRTTLPAPVPPSRALGTRPDPALVARIAHGRLALQQLDAQVRELIRTAPEAVRPFTPLLTKAMALSGAAERRYAAALSPRARNSGARGAARARVLLRQGNLLLHRSQQALDAFTIYVNGVGGQLYNG